MPDHPRALSALQRMAQLASGNNSAQPDGRDGRGRYERLTNDYQSALIASYARWTRVMLKQLADKDPKAQRVRLDASGVQLVAALQRVGQEHLPLAVSAIGVAEYIPSSEAWRMIADAVDLQAKDIATRLVPDVIAKLSISVNEGSDLADAAESMLARVGFYAGNLWVVIQRLVGDFAAQAETRDDLIYRCRWVLDPNAQHCPSCLQFAGEYPSYDAMLQVTNEAVPGYFVGSPYRSCWLNCRCKILLEINGEWVVI